MCGRAAALATSQAACAFRIAHGVVRAKTRIRRMVHLESGTPALITCRRRHCVADVARYKRGAGAFEASTVESPSVVGTSPNPGPLPARGERGNLLPAVLDRRFPGLTSTDRFYAFWKHLDLS